MASREPILPVFVKAAVRAYERLYGVTPKLEEVKMSGAGLENARFILFVDCHADKRATRLLSLSETEWEVLEPHRELLSRGEWPHGDARAVDILTTLLSESDEADFLHNIDVIEVALI